MKIIHCADIHLDANLKNPDLSIKKRNKEIRDTFIRLLDYAREHQAGAVIIAGDLLDSDLVSEETRRILLSNILKHSDIQFYYLRGNHDKANTLLAKGNCPANLFTFSENLKIYKTLLLNGRFISISGLETQGMDAREIDSQIKLDARDFNILCLHGQIRDYAQNGRRGEFDIRQLEHKNIQYLALGHVHKFQKGRLAPNGLYAYPGCLEGRGFDDAGEHGFIMLDINEETLSYKFTFVRFAGRKIGQIELDVTDFFSYDEIMNAVLEKARMAGLRHSDNLKLDLTGESFQQRLELDFLEEDLKKHFFRVKVNDRTKRLVTFAEYKYDISLRGEFGRILEEDPSLDADRKQKILECGISLLNEEY